MAQDPDRCRRDTVRVMTRTPLFLAVLWLSSPSWADDAALTQCRSVADSLARLACYDAIVIKGVRAAAATPTERFGLETRLPAASSFNEKLESRIVGKFEGWEPRTAFTLANDQVWAIQDGSRAYYELVDPRVTITRGAMGGYFMKIEGVAPTPRVRRVR